MGDFFIMLIIKELKFNDAIKTLFNILLCSVPINN